MFYTRNLFFCAMVTLLCACSDSDKSKNLPDTADTPDTTDTNETTFDVSTEVTAPTPEIISRLSLDTDFYKQYIDADGLPIVASTSVSPYALLEARWTIRKMMINRPDLMAANLVKPLSNRHFMG